MLIKRCLPLFLCICLPSVGFCDDDSSSGSDNSMATLKQDFENFTQYLGYDSTQTPPSSPPMSSALLTFTNGNEQALLTSIINAFFSAVPVNSAQSNASTFVPQGSSMASINSYANATFQSYNSSTAASGVSVNPLIDQATFQQDPVSQYVLNILATPSTTSQNSCPLSTSSTSSSCTGSQCPPLCQTTVINNVVGGMPPSDQYYTSTYNTQFVAELNANALIAPLMYTTDSSTNSNGGTTTVGLQAQNQAQLAENFIRFASGSTSPLGLPAYNDYASAYAAALETDGSNNYTADALQSQAVINTFFANLRVYAAQSSVVASNLYSILAKRLPQTPSGGQGTQTSEALAEFQMATWRILPQQGASAGDSAQWIAQINQATPSTVQKEMAILLAEINYQLYLSRQQQERILLTNSLLLLQTIQKPSTTLSSANTPAPDVAPASSDASS